VISAVIYQRAIEVEFEKANRDTEILRRFISHNTNTIPSPDSTQLYPSVALDSIARGLLSTSPPLQPSTSYLTFHFSFSFPHPHYHQAPIEDLPLSTLQGQH
jgi:hypothetical protein